MGAEDSYNGVDFIDMKAYLAQDPLDLMARTVDGIIDTETLDGSFDLSSNLDIMEFTLSLVIVPDDPELTIEAVTPYTVEAVDYYLDQILALFYRETPAELYIASRHEDRYLLAQINGTIAIDLSGTHLKVNIPMIALDPVWWSENSSSLAGNGTAVNSGNLLAKPVFTLVGPATNPKIYVGSEYFSYTGSLSGGDTLTVDCSKLTALFNSSNALENSNKTFPSLSVGNNSVSATAGTLTTTWRNSWL